METDIITGMPSPSPSAESSHSNMWKYLIIFLILAILGFNLFTYVGKFSTIIGQLTDNIIAVFKPILAYFGYGVTETAKKTIDLTAKGSKKAIDVASGTLTGGVNILQRGLSRGSAPSESGSVPSVRTTDRIDMPMPDDAGSTTQASKSKNKSGFCYIGEDRGFRSCISVGEGDTCMSGDIFPSNEICMNPSLRA